MEEKTPFYKSATKVVFVMLTIALIVGLFVGKVEQKDFIYLVGQVFAFYFGQKIGGTNNVNSENAQRQNKS